MNSVSIKILVNPTLVAALLLLSILVTPATYLLSSYKVPAGEIRFTQAAQTYLMDDCIDPDLVSPHHKQFLNPQSGPLALL